MAKATELLHPHEMATVPALWQATVTVRGDAPAVCVYREPDGSGTVDHINRTELASRVRRVACAVARRAVAQPGGLVGVVADNGWSLLVAMLGVMEAGNAYFPLAPPAGVDVVEPESGGVSTEKNTSVHRAREQRALELLSAHLATLLGVAGSRCTHILCDTTSTAERIRGAVQMAGLHHLVESIDDILMRDREDDESTSRVSLVDASLDSLPASNRPQERKDIKAPTTAVAGDDGSEHQPCAPLAADASCGSPMPTDPCWAFLTSGSTGARKLVLATHAEVVAYTSAIADRLSLSDATRWFVATSAGFDPNAGDALMTLLAGGVVCYAPWALTTGALARCVRRTGATGAGSTPAVWSLWGHDDVPPAFKVLTLGGETMPMSLASKWAPRVALWNLYGLTEGVVYQSTNLIPADITGMLQAEQDDVLRAIGIPLDSVAVTLIPAAKTKTRADGGEQVDDDDDDDDDDEEVFELVLSGNQLAATCCDKHGILRTGDYVARRASGTLVLRGRRDNQIKRSGRRVNLEEIDAAVARGCGGLVTTATAFCPFAGNQSVVECAVILTPMVLSDLAYAKATSGEPATGDHDHGGCGDDDRGGGNGGGGSGGSGRYDGHVQLRRLLPLALLDLARRRVPAHLLPSRLHVWDTDQLPTTASGKIDRRAVRNAAATLDNASSERSDASRDVSSTAARGGGMLSPLEHAIATVWADVLGVPIASLHGSSSLYELGADSLGALRVSRKLVELFCGEMDHTTFDARVGVIRGVFSPVSVLETPALAAYARTISAHPAVKAYLDARHGTDGVLPTSTGGGGGGGGGGGSSDDDAGGRADEHVSTTTPSSSRAKGLEIAPRTTIESAVLRAVWSHSNKLVAALIDASADVNGGVTRDRFGVTPLHAAAQAGNVVATRLLVDRGARVTATMQRHVMAAHVAAGKSVDVLRVLLEAGSPLHALDSNKQSLAHHAARAGQAECLALLVSLGAPLSSADRWHRLPLSWAALNGHLECADILTTARGRDDINFKVRPVQHAKRTHLVQEPPLHLASRLARSDIVLLLIERNANVHITDDAGRSALHAAALHVPPSLESLTLTGHDGNNVDGLMSAREQPRDGETRGPHGAGIVRHTHADDTIVDKAFEPCTRVVDALVAAGADVGYKNAGPDGVTPLHLAALVGNVGVVTALLSAGVSIDARDAMGRTPLDCALQPSPLVEGLRIDPWPAFRRAKDRILELLLAASVARDLAEASNH